MTWANFAVWNIRFIEQGIIWFQGSDEVFKIAWLKNCSKKNWDPASIFSSQEAVDVVKASALFRPQNRVTERNSTKSDEDKVSFYFLSMKDSPDVGRQGRWACGQVENKNSNKHSYFYICVAFAKTNWTGQNLKRWGIWGERNETFQKRLLCFSTFFCRVK